MGSASYATGTSFSLFYRFGNLRAANSFILFTVLVLPPALRQPLGSASAVPQAPAGLAPRLRKPAGLRFATAFVLLAASGARTLRLRLRVGLPPHSSEPCGLFGKSINKRKPSPQCGLSRYPEIFSLIVCLSRNFHTKNNSLFPKTHPTIIRPKQSIPMPIRQPIRIWEQ